LPAILPGESKEEFNQKLTQAIEQTSESLIWTYLVVLLSIAVMAKFATTDFVTIHPCGKDNISTYDPRLCEALLRAEAIQILVAPAAWCLHNRC
jgi:hypothetical protein